MPQAVIQTSHVPAKPGAPTPAAMPNREKALKILSKSIYKELRQNGYEPKQIVALATELISLVTSDIKDDARLD
jgi:hypothetical protein